MSAASHRITFHLDEHVDPAMAAALRRHGIDVTTTIEAGLRGADDQTQLGFATSHGRVLVTHDSDFLRLAKTDTAHSGIVLRHGRAFSWGDHSKLDSHSRGHDP
jgi:predicted nuclease of predicted toxin-antitoxin system